MRFFHTAISVSNLKQSRLFYQEVFGLTVRAKGARPELKVKFEMLEDKHGGMIELFGPELTVIPIKEDLMDFRRLGPKHLAFVVDDIEAATAKALKKGARLIWPIQPGVTVKRIAFVTDPDGIPIELVEL